MKRWFALGCVWLVAGHGRAALVTTEQSGISQGNRRRHVAESTDAKTGGFVSVFALWGSQSTPGSMTSSCLATPTSARFSANPTCTRTTSL